jgi:hypothetical protein
MKKFKVLNGIDESIALAERINDDGGIDVLVVVDGSKFGEDGFIVAIEYYNGRIPNDERVFDTKDEAIEYFNSLVE